MIRKITCIFLLLAVIALPAAFAQKQVTVKTTSKKQTIEGFGGSIAYYEGWVVAHSKRALIYDYLFKDLGLSIFRARNEYMNEGAYNQETSASPIK